MKKSKHRIIIFKYLAAFIILNFVMFSCKKGDNTSNPAPVLPPAVLPDTLSAGWQIIKIDSTETFSDIFFNTSANGYLSGKNKIYKTIDGGNNWGAVNQNKKFMNLSVTPAGSIYGIPEFTPPYNDSIYKSTDGGTSFSTTPSNDYLLDIFFADNNNGFITNINSVMYTTNAGISWNKILVAGSSASYRSLFYRNANLGWLIDGHYITRQNGPVQNWQTTWQFITVGDVSQIGNILVAIYAPSDNIVYTLSNLGDLYKSTNAGATFTLIKNFGSGSDVHFISDNVGYVCGGRRLYKTIDGGLTWSVEIALGNQYFSEIHFTDATHGWACGNKGLVLKFN